MERNHLGLGTNPSIRPKIKLSSLASTAPALGRHAKLLLPPDRVSSRGLTLDVAFTVPHVRADRQIAIRRQHPDHQ
ncbi:MAG: hypothetical protein GMKNLPBB_03333 [Myxococcota bacterium]|nr:hypothetical protein [Myxococcota bacterium]